MSVLACDRRNCEHVMCDRLIMNDSKYICEDCWQELLELKDSWETPMTALEVRRRVIQFFDTEPGTAVDKPCDIDEEFGRLTRNTR